MCHCLHCYSGRNSLRISARIMEWATTMFEHLKTDLCLHCKHRHTIVTADAQFLLLSFFFLLFGFHYLTEICTCYSSLETSAIGLKFQHSLQNGLNSHLNFTPTPVSDVHCCKCCEGQSVCQTGGHVNRLQRASGYLAYCCLLGKQTIYNATCKKL